MPAHLVAGFLIAVFPLVATPGASFTLLARHAIVAGPRAGVPVILGTVTGLFLHATLAAAGLSALIMRVSWGFTAVRLAGAVYLIGLGIWMWRTAASPVPGTPKRVRSGPAAGRDFIRSPGLPPAIPGGVAGRLSGPSGPDIGSVVGRLSGPLAPGAGPGFTGSVGPLAARSPRGGSRYTQALLGNVLNPKAASIFLTLAPQFTDPARPVWPQVMILAAAQSALVALWLCGWAVLLGRTGRSRLTARAIHRWRRAAAITLIGLGVRAAAT